MKRAELEKEEAEEDTANKKKIEPKPTKKGVASKDKKVRFQAPEKDENDEWEDIDDEDEEWEDVDEEPEADEEDDVKEISAKEEPKKNEISITKHQEEVKKEENTIQEEPINLQNFKLAQGVRTKLYDENGIPVDGYNYYQHLKEPGSGGPATFSYVAEYEKLPEIAVDIDLKPKEMTPEQLEVLAALNYEGEDQAYEELDDDFIKTANDGMPCLIPKAENKAEVQKKSENRKEAPLTNPELADKKGKDNLLKSVLREPKSINKKEIAKNKKHPEENSEESDEQSEDDIDEEESDEEEEEEGDGQKQFEKSVPMAVLDKDKIPFNEDVAMQNTLAEDSLDSDIDFEKEYSETTRDGETIDNSIISTEVKTQKLNIIKEATNKKKKSLIDKEQPEEKKIDKNVSALKPNDETKEKTEDPNTIRKRKNNETPEEKKARKEALKQIKQERKTKKKDFKEIFDNQKNKVSKVKQAQITSLAGYSIIKL